MIDKLPGTVPDETGVKLNPMEHVSPTAMLEHGKLVSENTLLERLEVTEVAVPVPVFLITTVAVEDFPGAVGKKEIWEGAGVSRALPMPVPDKVNVPAENVARVSE